MRTVILQLIGLLSILLLIFFALPRGTQAVSAMIGNKVEQQLHAEGLTWVKVNNQDRQITLSGETQYEKEHQNALDIARSFWFVKQVEDNISPKLIVPYSMKIKWKDDQLSLQGYVSNDKKKETIQQHINDHFNDKKTQIDLQTGVGAPKGWHELNTKLLTKIKDLPLVSVHLLDQTVDIAGKVQTSKEIEALQADLKTFEEQDYHFNFQLIALDNAAIICQKEFNRLLSLEKIRFNTGSATIDSRSDTLLRSLADTALFCANSTLLISGHTDNVGNETDNINLSLQRAKAVKGRLFNQGGVPLERLKTLGKGSNEPIADNDTEAGRATNRRIELIVEGI